MRPAHFGYLALAILAGTAGYVMQQQRLRVPLASAPSAVSAQAEVPAAPAVAADLFAWSLPDPAGQSQALAQWRGRVLVLNFWATWCPPCLKEIPAFIELQRRYGARGLQFVGIALDQVEAVRPFIADHRLNYPVLVGDQDVARLMTGLGNDIGGLPYTVVIGRDGTVLTRHQGEWAADAAAAVFEDALGQP